MSLQRRRGYTLLEVVVSMFSAGILIAGLGSALSLASRSASVSAASSAAAEASAAAAEILNDLQTVKVFSSKNGESFTAVVADRTGDGTDDTLVYDWSKNKGEPLTKRVNGGAVSKVIPAIQHLKFEYLSKDGSIWATRVIIQSTTDAASEIELLAVMLNRP